MEIITKSTIRVGKGREAKYLKAGTHDVDDAIGKALVEKGVASDPAAEAKAKAKAAAEAKAEAEAKAKGGK